LPEQPEIVSIPYSITNFKTMQIRKKIALLAWLLLLCCCYRNTTFAQNVSETVSANGFSLQKSVSLTSVKTNDLFTYTITFSIPAGATDVVISDNVPAPLVINNTVPATGSVTYSGVPATLSVSGNNVALYFPGPVPVSISGSLQINVRFPVTNSCDGLTVSNVAILEAKRPATSLRTKGVNTRAMVTNPWRITKWSPSSSYTGTLTSSPCNYGTTQDTAIRYQIRIAKNNYTLSGSASLYNINLQDILPAGAIVNTGSFTSTVPGATFSPPNINLPAGFSLDASTNPIYDFSFAVHYSSPLSIGTCTINKATLSGNYLCNTTTGALYRDSAQSNVQKIDTPAIRPNSKLIKWANVSGNMAGCTGTYYIRVQNNGTATQPAYTLTDNMPTSCITVTGTSGTGISVSGSTYTISGGALAPGAYHQYSFSFVINSPTCGPLITNKVIATSGFSDSSTAYIALLPNGAQPCIDKAVCGAQNYSVNSPVRFRLRVQNIGSNNMTSAVIQDQLDVNALQYIGNEYYFSMPNLGAPPACGSGGGTAWSGVTTSHNTTTGLLKWNLPNIPAECASIVYPACGFAYYQRAYYIEFTALIKDTAALGNIKNLMVISGPSIPTVKDSTTFVVNGTVNYSLNKLVSKDGSNFSSSVTAPANSTVQYNLSVANSGIGLRFPTLIDRLPRNNGSSDVFTLYNSSRSSAYDIRYNSFISSTLPPATIQTNNTPNLNTIPEMSASSGSTTGTWGPATAGHANLKSTFNGSIGTSFNYIFGAITDPSAPVDATACNSFAFRASAKYQFNYVPTYVLQPPLESGTACVTIEKGGCCDPIDFSIPAQACLGISQQFCVKDTCQGNVYTWDFGDGSPTVNGTCVNHTYTSAGGYTIKVTWKNDCGGDGKTFDIKIVPCDCDIEVSWSLVASGLTVNASGASTTSSLPIALYVWDFGDGSFGTGVNATHTYTYPGTYVVKLTVYAMTDKGTICDCVKECASYIKVTEDYQGEYGCKGNAGVKKTAPTVVADNNNITLKALPNPFNSEVVIDIATLNKQKLSVPENYTLEISTSTGVVLQSKKLQSLDVKVVFDMSRYTSGNYFALLKSATGEVKSLKLIKL
jgi:PKD repeat protein